MLSKKSKIHLKEEKMTALEHLWVAWRLSFECLKMSIATFLHGIMPGFFKHYTSNKIKELHKMFEARNGHIRVGTSSFNRMFE